MRSRWADRIRLVGVAGGDRRLCAVRRPSAARARVAAFRSESECLRLSADGHDAYVANFRTALEVPAIWEEFYEPLIRDYPLESHGGGSTHSTAASDPARSENYLTYLVTPPPRHTLAADT
jgi:hypothetical protein